jgi:hypothetical protein
MIGSSASCCDIWLGSRSNCRPIQDVRGVIVASEVTEDLKLAASLIQNVRLYEYAIAMKLSRVDG